MAVLQSLVDFVSEVWTVVYDLIDTSAQKPVILCVAFIWTSVFSVQHVM